MIVVHVVVDEELLLSAIILIIVCDGKRMGKGMGMG